MDLLHKRVRINFRKAPSNCVQLSAANSQSFVNFSRCISQNFNSPPSPLTTTSPTFLCSFHPLSLMTPNPSLPSWPRWKRSFALVSAMTHSTHSTSTSTRNLDSSRINTSMFDTKAPIPNHESLSREFPPGSQSLQTGIPLLTRRSMHSTRTPRPSGGPNFAPCMQTISVGCRNLHCQITLILSVRARFW